MKKNFPLYLLIIYLIFFVITGINPTDRTVWVAEIIPVIIILILLIIIHQKFRFSNLSYIMMSVFIFLHTIGAHYTFAEVPFNFITDLFNFQRNHFDRIAHFSVGFYAYPIAEFMYRKKIINSVTVICLFSIFSIFTVAAVYEIIEWWYAVLSDPQSGTAFLGSQGDIWDAQKDMLADGLGSIFATIVWIIKK